ncbi:MAG: hypothetical protein U0183_22275 [Polyangiaceae bacterium]
MALGMRRSRTAWVVGLALSSVPLVGYVGIAAGAGSEAAGVDLRFVGACGSRPELATKLAARGVRVAPGAVPLEVETRATPDGATGTFVIGEGDARRSRTLTAESCDAMLDALALAVELAILPERPPPPAPSGGVVVPPPGASATSPLPASTPSASARPAGAPGAIPSPSAGGAGGVPSAPAGGPGAVPSASASVPGAIPPTSTSVVRAAPPTAAEAPPSRRAVEVVPRWEGAGLVAFGAAAFASPVLSPRVQLEAEVGRRLGPVLVPTVVLGVGATLPTSTERSGASVSFAAQWAELGLCPVRFGQGWLTARPCLRLDVGRSEAKSEGVTGAKLVGSPFGAVGPTLGARLRAFGPAFVEGSLEALVVFSRSEFLFDNFSVYDMPWVRVAARLAVGVSIP